jgi:hypothetical protein
MPTPPPSHQRRQPRPTRNQRIARRTARQNQARDTHRLSADNSAFLELASLQFEALARQTNNRHRSRSVSPAPRFRSRSPPPLRSSYRARSPATTTRRRFSSPSRRASPIRPPAASPRSGTTDFQNPFTVTGRDLSPHQEAGSTARPSPEAEESIIGWEDYRGHRQDTPRGTDSYRPVYDQQPAQRGNRTFRGSRGSRGFRGTRGPSRSLFDRITPRQ